MITPLSLEGDPDEATAAELVAAFVADGWPREDAEAYVAAIRGPIPTGD